MPVKIRFDGAPGAVGGRFIEVEDGEGRGLRFGRWEKDPEGSDWFLVITIQDMLEALKREFKDACDA